MQKVVVMGLGYVGLPLASSLSSAGYETVGFDIDNTVIAEASKRSGE
jgi:UDP-N-acetyl-D-mannosaminuronate dehydrogenase